MDIANPKTLKDYLGLLVALILVSFAALLLRGAVQQYNTLYPQADAVSMIAAKEEWITYTNINYGYQISYPPELKFTRSSELAARPAPAGKEDQLILIKDLQNERLYTIAAGSFEEFTAISSAEMKRKYEEIVVPQLINGSAAKQSGLTLTPADFKITEITFAGRPAIEVVSPLGFTIEVLNSNGNTFDITARDYTGATTTTKEQLTREIMETFRVLD